MPHIIRKHGHHKPGTAPGTLVAPVNATASIISAICYDEKHLEELVLSSPEDVTPLLEKWSRVWINVVGLGDISVLERFGEIFGLHRLALEDVLNLSHRPKTESFGDILFVINRMASIREGKLDIEQISLFAGKGFVLTFQEQAGDSFDPVRVRLRNGVGRLIRRNQTDYLAYALMDAVIDGYYPVLEHFSERLNLLEDDVVENPQKRIIVSIHDIKRDLRQLSQSVWPMREMVNEFAADTLVISDDIQPYIRDIYDHIIHVLDILESLRERSSSLIDIYLSSIGNRTNEVMRVLTIIATIFIPLSFIAGLYGMNFDTASPWNMPELNWYWGYPFALAVMTLVAGGLLLYFKRKGWFD